MPSQILPVTGLDTIGVNKDTPPVALPSAAFSDVRNVRFRDGAVLKMEGEVNLFPTELLTDTDGNPSTIIDSDSILKYAAWWPNPNLATSYTGYYLIIVQKLDTEDDTQKDFAYIALPDGTVSLKGKFQPDDQTNWQHTFFQGGFCLIINNGLDVPSYILDDDGNTDISSVPEFKELPGWESYNVNQVILDDTFQADSSHIFDLGQSVDFAINELVVTNEDDTLTPIAGDPAGEGTPNEADFVPGTYSSSVSQPSSSYSIYEDTETGTTIIYLSNNVVVGNNVRVNIRSRDPVSVRCGVIRSYGDFLVAANLTERSEEDNDVIVRNLPGIVRSSDVALPGSIPSNWNPFASGTSTADEFVVTQEGIVQDMVELQGSLYIYSNSSISAMSRTGNPSIPLAINTVTDAYGVQTTDAVLQFDGQHFVVGSQDVYIFGGHPGNIKSVADGRVRDYLFNRLNPLHEQRMFAIRNRQKDEIWICFPTASSVTGECDEALIWNYRKNNWTIRDLYNVVSGDVGPVPGGGVPIGRVELSGTTGTDGTINIGAFDVQLLQMLDSDLPGDNLVGNPSQFTLTVDSDFPRYNVQGSPIFHVDLGNSFNSGSDPAFFFAQGFDVDDNEVFDVQIELPASITTKADFIDALEADDEFNEHFLIQDSGNDDQQFFIQFTDEEVINGTVSVGNQVTFTQDELVRDSEHDIGHPSNQYIADTDTAYSKVVASVYLDSDQADHVYYLEVLGENVPEGVQFREYDNPDTDMYTNAADALMYRAGRGGTDVRPQKFSGDTESQFMFRARIENSPQSSFTNISEPWYPKVGWNHIGILVPDTDTFEWNNDWNLLAYDPPSITNNADLSSLVIDASLRDYHGDHDAPPVITFNMASIGYNTNTNMFDEDETYSPITTIAISLGGDFSDTDNHHYLIAEHISHALHTDDASLFDTTDSDNVVTLTSRENAQHYIRVANIMPGDADTEFDVNHIQIDTDERGRWPFSETPGDTYLDAVYPTIRIELADGFDSNGDTDSSVDTDFSWEITLTNDGDQSTPLTPDDIMTQIIESFDTETMYRWSGKDPQAGPSLPLAYVQRTGNKRLVAANSPRPVAGRWRLTVTNQGNIQLNNPWEPFGSDYQTKKGPDTDDNSAFTGEYEKYATPSYMAFLIRNNEALNNREVIIIEAPYTASTYNVADHDGVNGVGGTATEAKNRFIERLRLANRRLNVFDRGETEFIIQPANYDDSANFVLETVLNDNAGIERFRELASGFDGDTEITVNASSDTLFINVFDTEVQVASIGPEVAGDNDSQIATAANRRPDRIDRPTDATLSNDAVADSDDNVFDIDRPWPSDEVNFNKQFPILAANVISGESHNINKITGADIGYSRPLFSETPREDTYEGNDRIISGNDSELPITSYVYRAQLPLTPEFTTETLSSIALWTDGSYKPGFTDSDRYNRLAVETFGTDAPGAGRDNQKQVNNTIYITEGYKVDTRTQGRFLNIYVGDQANTGPTLSESEEMEGKQFHQNSEWRLSGIQLEIMEGGRR